MVTEDDRASLHEWNLFVQATHHLWPKEKPMRYALLVTQKTDNLGDDIQSLAALKFLPRVDAYVDREQLNEASAKPFERLAVILNGWFCDRPLRWPPHPAIVPCVISFHATPEKVRGGHIPSEILFTEPSLEFFRSHQPIGARDLWTLEKLRSNGIESYFSGCLTLAFDRPAVERSDDLVVLNDLPLDLEAFFRTRTTKRVVTTSHVVHARRELRERLRTAQSLLALYARSSCVVTTRLHCALPCLAMNVPVLYVERRAGDPRLAGYESLFWSASPAEILAGKVGFDINEPLANPHGHEALRSVLTSSIVAFVQDCEDAARFAS